MLLGAEIYPYNVIFTIVVVFYVILPINPEQELPSVLKNNTIKFYINTLQLITK